MSSTTNIAQIIGISVSLIASGGIATLSIFDTPLLQSQPASRSLPSTRWLFSRGSHIFPQAAFLSSASFAYLAYAALPLRSRGILQLLKLTSNGAKVNGYLAAAALAISIAPWTALVMIPTNFTLIKINEEKGGARSQKSGAVQGGGSQAGHRSAEDSVDGKGEAEEFTDLSGPQTKTDQQTTEEDDEKVRELLGKFALLNSVRAVLMVAGGVVGLWTALAL